MKKNLLLLICIIAGFTLNAQDLNKQAALQLVSKNMASIGLTQDDLNNVFVSDAYFDKSAGVDMVYLQQIYKGLPVYNQIQVLAFKNGKTVSNAGGRIHDAEKISKDMSPTPAISAESAVRTAMDAKKITGAQPLFASVVIPGRKLNFGKLGIAHEDVTAELLWVPLNDGKKMRLAWQVYLVPLTSSDYWVIRVDANSNKVIDENNLTVYCNWNPDKKAPYANLVEAKNTNPDKTENLNHLLTFSKYNNNEEVSSSSPLIVNDASYRVVPLPAESPKHTGGTPALVNNPWTLAPGNATSLKWHSNGTTDYNITRGNNVWAKEDHAANNSNGGQPATSTTPAPLTFDFAPNFFKQPNQTTPVPNQQFNITNLFYWINTYHDIMYQYGFDEPAGNFQDNNQGRGGQGTDYVFGDAQDGNYVAPNQDNANFSTPADGGNGRMQMYLWDTSALCVVNSPAAIARTYGCAESAFSTANKLINLGPVTGQVVYYNDDAGGTTHEACSGAPTNSVAGKIALIDRGNCTFVIKVKAAQNAGAIGVIMVNNVATPTLIIMAGADNTITIPAVCISQSDGLVLKGQLANNINVTLGAANVDGDVDNGVITHEHTHGLSNRLTGGPSQAGCLSNAEHAGEGWSDYYGLMFTQDWLHSDLQSGFEIPRPIGTYVIGQSPSGSGIRSQKYCTDFSINNLVYGASIDAESHNRGELWCATLWDMTWNIINQVGTINPNIYDIGGGGGNTIALKLVTEGMKLQPCSPGFIDGRNAILQADQVLYGGAYDCAIREAFRRRGMGDNASQGSSNSVTDQVADFAPINCATCTNVTTTTQPSNATACTGGNVSFVVAATGTTPAYQWQVSTDGGTNYSDITGATTATLTLNAVTSGMNNNRYRAVITNSCPSNVTSNAAILTVNDPASITAQPADFAGCAGANANFSVTASGSANTYQWQVSTNGGATFTDITGATGTTLSIPNITGALNGNIYHVVISSCGPNGITSSNVTLTVNTPAAIATQPANTSACTGGGDATFTVGTTGTNVTYQWQVSTNGGGTFTNITGATAATLTVTGITSAMNNNVYQVIISNPCTSSITSSQAVLAVSDPAAITTQPSAATICAGSNTSFTIVTAGTGVTYQWQVSTDGGTTFTDITGATSATLNLSAVTSSMNNNQYHVLVFSCSPTGLSSNNVTLTVNSPVSITTQPANVNACAGGNANISVTAAGTANSYQWQVSTDAGNTFADITGANSATLALTGITAGMNNNIYHVIISNTCTVAAVTSANATLAVTNAAAITTQPVNATACAGSNASFSANASGSSYQWQVSTDGGVTFTDIPGANTTTLDLTSVTGAMNNNQYQLVIGSCGSGSISTNHVTLTVNTPASVTTNPASTTVCSGTDATFTVSAAGTSNSYQWSVSTDGGTTFNIIPGANAASLTVPGTTTAMSGNLYQVSVSNSCVPSGVSSLTATLTVTPATAISTDPAAATACEGSSVTFSASAINATGATYQWQVSTNGGTSFTDVPGANTATLTISGVTASMNNSIYHLVVSGCGTATSAGAALTVSSLPTVTITASPYVNLTNGLSTTLTATSNPPSSVFAWYKNNQLIPSATTNTLVVNYGDTGIYRAEVTGTNGCSNSSSLLAIGDSVVSIAFIFPNPNDGHFYVTFKGTGLNGQPRIITMYDAKGARVYQKAHQANISYEKMEVNVPYLSKGTYALVLSDAAGNTLGTGKVIIQ